MWASFHSPKPHAASLQALIHTVGSCPPTELTKSSLSLSLCHLAFSDPRSRLISLLWEITPFITPCRITCLMSIFFVKTLVHKSRAYIILLSHIPNT